MQAGEGFALESSSSLLFEFMVVVYMMMFPVALEMLRLIGEREAFLDKRFFLSCGS